MASIVIPNAGTSLQRFFGIKFTDVPNVETLDPECRNFIVEVLRD